MVVLGGCGWSAKGRVGCQIWCPKRKRKRDAERFTESWSYLGEWHGVLGGCDVSHASGAFQDVTLELIRGVQDAHRGLRARRRAADSAGGFGGVATEEGALIQEQNAASVFQHGVRGAETGETAADDDDLLAHLNLDGAGGRVESARRCDERRRFGLRKATRRVSRKFAGFEGPNLPGQ